jgi:hypothetical protein
MVQLMPSYYQQGNLRPRAPLYLLGAPLQTDRYTIEPWLREGKTFAEWVAAGKPVPMPDLLRRVATVQTVPALEVRPADQTTAQVSTNGWTVTVESKDMPAAAVEPSIIDKARAWLDSDSVIAGYKNWYVAGGAGLVVYLLRRK